MCGIPFILVFYPAMLGTIAVVRGRYPGVIFAVATGGLMSGSILEREKRHMGREKLMGGMKNST